MFPHRTPHPIRAPRPAPWTSIRLAATGLALGAFLLATAAAPSASAGILPGVRVFTGDLKRIACVRTAGILAGAAALGAASLLVENPDAEERALGRGAIDVPADFGNIYGGGILLAGAAGGLAGAGVLEKDPDWIRAGSEMGRSMLYTGIAVTALKVAVRRTRPNGGAYSFPSGHTAIAFAVAPVLARRFGLAAALPAYALATSTALGRMEDRMHFLSDVVVGAGIGTAIGMAIASDRRERTREADEDCASMKPVLGIGVAASGLALTARF